MKSNGSRGRRQSASSRNVASILLLSPVVLLFAATLLTVATGTASASIPDANGVYHACLVVGQKSQQIAYVIDTAVVTTCPKNEIEGTWSQTGPQGPVGTTGAQGPMGPMGATGAMGLT